PEPGQDEALHPLGQVELSDGERRQSHRLDLERAALVALELDLQGRVRIVAAGDPDDQTPGARGELQARLADGLTLGQVERRGNLEPLPPRRIGRGAAPGPDRVRTAGARYRVGDCA